MAIDISNLDNYPYLYDNISIDEKVRFYSAQFGDGYEERRTKGINPVLTDVQSTFVFKTKTAYMNFLALLRSSINTHFLWQSPVDNVPERYVIDSWSVIPESPELFKVSCRMRRWYGS